ncbi:MAG: glycosyltransferase family A protein [Clostridium sp.]
MNYKYLVTIFTTTYNRAELLKRLYESLKEQSDKDFEWIIVDDGSKDNTKEVVQGFIKEKIIPIKYLKKENEGKHIAINVGCDMAEGELFFIVDSDDYIPKEAIEEVKRDWKKYRNNTGIAGLVYLKAWKNGNLMGRKFEKDEFISNHVKEYNKGGVWGEKLKILRTEIFRKNKFPKYENEKYVGEHVLWIEVSRKYDLVYINKVLYIAEYLEDGLTMAGRKLRIENPLGGIKGAQVLMQKDMCLKLRIKNNLLYSSYSFFAERTLKEIYKGAVQKFLLTLELPFGYVLYRYWKKKFL